MQVGRTDVGVVPVRMRGIVGAVMMMVIEQQPCGGVPGGNCARHCVAILRYAEHAECSRAMIGKIAVEIGPAPVPGRIEAHDSVSRGRNSCAGELNVVAAAQRSCGLAKINCHSLTPPGTSLPQLR